MQTIKYRDLDIRLLSADDLKNINIFKKMDVYALAYILGHDEYKNRTNVEKHCGTRPRWNHKMTFPIEERTIMVPGLTLLVQIKAKTLAWNEILGEVYIIIPDLFQEARIAGNGEQDGEKIVDYQVKTLSGRGKGVLKIAYSFGGISTYDITDDVDKSKKTNPPIVAHPDEGKYDGQVCYIPGIMGAPQGCFYSHQGYSIEQHTLPPQPHYLPLGYGNYLPLSMYKQPVHGVGFPGMMMIGNMMPNVVEMDAFTKGCQNSMLVES